MLNKILIATDFSPASDCLLQSAVSELKKLGLKQVVLAHIIYVANTPGLDDLLKKEAAPELERQKNLLTGAGIEVVVELGSGIPAHEIDALASAHGVDAILIGSRGRSLANLNLGRVSFKLLQLTGHPVFLARINKQGEGDSCKFSVRSDSFSHILFPTDFSRTSERAFHYLENIVREYKAKATLLHVYDAEYHEYLSPEGIEEQRSFDGKRLEEMKQRLIALGGQVSVEFAVGHPAEEIIARTKNGQASLVIMGNHGKGFIKEAIFGSVANEVARQAEAPVFFIPDIH